MSDDSHPNKGSGTTTLVTVLIVVAVLYFARTVLIPLALAILLAFLLAPLVVRLRRWGWGRVPGAVSVVALFFVMLGIIGAVMTSQLTDLAHKLPEYQENMHKKVEAIRTSGGGFVNRVSQVIGEVTDGLTPQKPAPAQKQPGEERPVPVEIRRSAFSPFEAIQKVLGSLLNIVMVAAIVIVFVIFILIEQEDLRDRLIRLAGARRVQATTNLLNDAAQRVSRYLLAQLVINVGFGVVAGVGLYFIKVPNPLLWGMLAALLRYIPYAGIWVAATMAAAAAFAVEPGWVKVPIIYGMYFGTDLLMYNFVEPVLYGTSTGISPLAILVAAVFWTWLWGPVGLLLATPLTVCVVVIGRHVPALGFLRVLLTDEPVLQPSTQFYQRMLAMDLEEATEVAEEFLKGKSLEDLYDLVIIPALTLGEEDRHQGRLDERRQQFIFQNTRILIEDVADREAELVVGDDWSKKRGAAESAGTGRNEESPSGATVLCIPARDEADELAALMLMRLLRKRGIAGRTLSSVPLAGESLAEVSRERPKVACVLGVPPLGYLHTRYLCRRLRTQFENLKIVGAILTEHDVAELKRRHPAIVADELAASLREALAQVLALLDVESRAPAQPALRAA